MKVGIIGAGPGGLISARYARENGYECEVFEQTGNIGGTWYYTDNTEKDELGFPVHSAMYQNLKTNLPKEVMFSMGFPYSTDIKDSYIAQPLVLDYIHKFADHFKLHPYVKLYHRVELVKPLPENRWQVTVKNLKTNTEETKEFDAVMICCGHYYKPYIPEISGIETFKGKILHSRTYRNAEHYKNENVLVIGAAYSGQDITKQIATTAKTVFLSHRRKKPVALNFDNVVEKPEVAKVLEHEVEFTDGTKQPIDTILYATGYWYSYPFLSKECKINVDNNWVQYLYKHIVNIEYPTMFFMGIPLLIAIIPLMDLQARFAMSVLSKNVTLPSKEKMLEEIVARYESLKAKGVPKKYYHMFPDADKPAFFMETAIAGNVKPLPPVLGKIYLHGVNAREGHVARLPAYRIIDDETFEVTN